MALLTLSDGHGAAATFYSVPLPIEDLPEEDDSDDVKVTVGCCPGIVTNDVEVPRADVELDGASHVLHPTRNFARWAPDEAYLAAHSKAKLLGLLKELGVENDRAKAPNKDALVTFAAEAAAERQWALAAPF